MSFKCASDVISVIREECSNATKFLNRTLDEQKKSSSIMKHFTQGRKIYPWENVDRVETRTGRPAAVAFDSPDLSQKGYKNVEIQGRNDCGNEGSPKTVLGNHTLPCDDTTIVDITTGFKEDSHYDYEKDFSSNVECVKSIWNLQPERVKDYWDAKVKGFADFLAWNKEQNFISFFMEFGGANSVAVEGIHNSSKIFTEGNFLAEPTHGLSVAHLVAYRDRMLSIGGLGFNEKLVVPAPKKDIVAAIKFHTQDTNPGACIDIAWNEENGEGYMNGRQKFEYENIMFVVDEMPCKGFFKGGKLVPVFPWKSGAEGFVGQVDDYNEQYRNSCVYCEGKKYPMVNLIFIGHKDAIIDHPFHAPINPADKSADFNNSMRVLTGNEYSLGCNKNRDKFQLTARIGGRLAFGDTNRMGVIAYLAESACGTMREICGTCDESEVCEAPVYGTELQEGANDSPCADCGDDGTTVPANGVVNLEEKDVETYYDGSTGELTIWIKRSGDTSLAGTVDFTLADGTALAGTQYTDVSGTATFAAGSNDSYAIVIPITGSIDPTSDFTITLSNGVNVDLGACIDGTVTIIDATSDCVSADCTTPVAP